MAKVYTQLQNMDTYETYQAEEAAFMEDLNSIYSQVDGQLR